MSKNQHFKTLHKHIYILNTHEIFRNKIQKIHKTGADPGFQVRGGALKKNCAERREAGKFLGYFV